MMATLPASISVYPSGADFISSLTPILVDAPGRFSTTIVPFSTLPRGLCRARATRSFAPPAANGTITRMGLLGYACAKHASAMLQRTTPPSAARNDLAIFMATPLLSGGEDDLADVGAAVEILVRARNVLQRMHRVD